MKGSGIGGQAVMEGVMMKNGSKYAVAVRKPDGDIVVDTQIFKKFGEGIKLFDLPIFRGVAAFIDSLRLGVGTLMYSANFFEDDEPAAKKKTPEQQKKEDKVVMTLTVIFAVVMAVGIFMVLPYFLSQLLKQKIESTALLTLLEGVIRIVLFIGYIAAISCMKDIKRVFMYHGAEHKSINCIEHGLELTVANVRKSSRRHKRCGTSFLLVVMLISVFLFMFIRVDQAWLRIVLRLLLVPVIAGISYEFIRLAGNSNSKIVDIISKPGLALQGLTTRDPDDSMIEVAIASVEAVFDWKEFLEHYNEKEDKKCDLTGRECAGDTAEGDGAQEAPAKEKGAKNNNGKNNSGNSQGKAAQGNAAHGKGNQGKNNQGKQNKPSGNVNKDNNNRGNSGNTGNTDINRKKADNAGRNNSAGDNSDRDPLNIKLNDALKKIESVKKKAETNADNSEAEKADKIETVRNTDRAGKAETISKKDKTDKIDKIETARNTEKTDNAEAARNSEKTDKADKTENSRNTGRSADDVKKDRGESGYRGVREAIPVEDDDDDEILKALDQYFGGSGKNNN